MVLERFTRRLQTATGQSEEDLVIKILQMQREGIEPAEIFRQHTYGSGNGPQHATNPWYQRNIREGEKKVQSEE